jgi:hypothetical protein
MTEAELLDQVAQRLRKSRIPFMVVGSVASSYHGEPRLSYDIDLVVEADEERILEFVRSFAPPFYVSETAARQAVGRRGMFNVIHPDCEQKADIILCKDDDFNRGEFARKAPALVWGVEVDVATPEDTILAKLAWARRSGSERQRNDALGILTAQQRTLDIAYLRHWAAELGVEETLDALVREAASPPSTQRED